MTDEAGKKAALAVVSNMRPEVETNLGAGLKAAYEQMTKVPVRPNAIHKYNLQMLVLTDGRPTPEYHPGEGVAWRAYGDHVPCARLPPPTTSTSTSTTNTTSPATPHVASRHPHPTPPHPPSAMPPPTPPSARPPPPPRQVMNRDVDCSPAIRSAYMPIKDGQAGAPSSRRARSRAPWSRRSWPATTPPNPNPNLTLTNPNPN